jgi:hypothetical protein
MENETASEHSYFFRLKAMLGLGCANLFLLHDEWLLFFLILALTIFFEILHLKFNEVLNHNAKIALRNEKAFESRNKEKMLDEVRRQRELMESDLF